MALLAYPNFSEGRDRAAIDAIAEAFGPGLVDVHSDPDHHRTACTLVGRPGELSGAVLAGVQVALDRVRLDGHDGVHPRVGVVDVAPVVWTASQDRGAAAAEALVVADRLGSELAVPVLLYGELAGGRTRAELRRGGPATLAARIAAGELTVDFGPTTIDPAVGATLVAARGPLVALNLVLGEGVDLEAAKAAAAAVREGGPDGLNGVRAIGVWLATRGRAQVSCNLDDPAATSAGAVSRAVARHVAVDHAELVGLAPAAALEDLPDQIPLIGRQTIEDALAAHGLS